jgi:hypothetical protein
MNLIFSIADKSSVFKRLPIIIFILEWGYVTVSEEEE